MLVRPNELRGNAETANSGRVLGLPRRRKRYTSSWEEEEDVHRGALVAKQ